MLSNSFICFLCCGTQKCTQCLRWNCTCTELSWVALLALDCQGTLLTHVQLAVNKSLGLKNFTESHASFDSANLKSPSACGVFKSLKCLQIVLVGSTTWVALRRAQASGQEKWLFTSTSHLWYWIWSTVCNFWLPKGRKKKAGKAGDLSLFYQQTRRLKESIIAVFSSLFPSYRKVGARLLSEMQSEAAEK